MPLYKYLPIINFAEYIKKDTNKKKPKGLVFGNFGAFNKGDDAILTGEMSNLYKAGIKDVKVVCRFKNYYNQESFHSVELRSPFECFKQIVNSDFLIIGGGGLIAKNDKSISGIFFQVYMLVLFMLLPILISKKVYAIGLGIYNNANFIILRITLYLLKRMSLITVRDDHSFDLLTQYGVSSKLNKDLSYLMSLKSLNNLDIERLFYNKFRENNFNIGVSLVELNSKQEKAIVNYIDDHISRNTKTSIWFYCLDTHPNYHSDIEIAQKMINLLKKKYKLKQKKVVFNIVNSEVEAAKFFASFRLMNVFVAMRLHAMIFCYRQNIPFVGFPYDEKCSSFLESINQSKTYMADTTLNYSKGFIYDY